MIRIRLLLLAALAAGQVRAADWPTYQHDVRRSGATQEQLDAQRLIMRWTWRSQAVPQPAWAGPAKWDAYAGHRDLPSMRAYDLVFHPIAVGDAVYFGSSIDDSLYCLDAGDGRQRWTLTTDGPIRTAPTYADGKLYFGSDDGHAYCVAAADGALLWRYRPAPQGRKIINNGRLISLHPCRTGVLVDGGVAYFACALLPWQDAYLCGVDAVTGKAEGPSCFVQQLAGATLEGPPAATSDLLVFPQGRVAPQTFRRADGRDQGRLPKSSGGSLVVVAMDSHVFHGPAADSRRGGINSSNPDKREMIASHGRGNALAVAGDRCYMLTDNELIASDLTRRKILWKVPCAHPLSLVVAGDTLFAGGEDEVAALAADDGRIIWRSGVHGKAMGLAVAGGRLLVSTDAGVIHAFAEGPQPGPQPAPPPKQKQASDGEPTVRLAAGPWLQFTAPGEAIARWHTAQPSPTHLEYWLDGPAARIVDAAPKTFHEVRLTGLKHRRVYRYRIHILRDGRESVAGAFECDTFFNYALPPVPAEAREIDASAGAAAAEILAQTDVRRGICLVVGSGDGKLAYELARRSALRVIGVDTDPRKVRAARELLKGLGVYGSRVAVHHVEDLAALPFVGHFANLVTSERSLTERAFRLPQDEVQRVLRPDGGTACVLRGAVPFSRRKNQDRSQPESDARPLILVRGPLPGAGAWSHIYGRADNAAYGGEQLAGAASAADLAVQWVGRPGPRYQPDRQGRKPSPLSTAGRLFLQGLHRILALDAYNGSVLWALEIPDLARFNMPRDCGNWCADRRFVYLAVRDKCWQIDARDGRVVRLLDVLPAARDDWQYDWGYLASHQGRLLGSAVKADTSWTGFWGGADAGWYDARSGAVTDKVCSDNLFAIDKQSAEQQWTYSGGVIINSTITVAQDRVYFVECRHEAVKQDDQRRVGRPELWQDQFLVALDVNTGSIVWEQPIDTADGTVVFYMAHGDDRLVTVSSTDVQYHVNVFSSERGQSLWQHSFRWPGGKGDHGKAMSRPAIVGGRLYVRPQVFELADGSPLSYAWPAGHGCGTYSCSDGALFFRSANVTMWDRATGQASSWPRLRPDCWLTTIPAAGMLLSPEGGGGCSCGTWMETSLGFMPAGH